MATRGLDWEELTRLLKARSVAGQAVEVLDGATPITKEVDVVYNNTKSDTHKACDYHQASNGYNSNSGHSNNNLG